MTPSPAFLVSRPSGLALFARCSCGATARAAPILYAWLRCPRCSARVPLRWRLALA